MDSRVEIRGPSSGEWVQCGSSRSATWVPGGRRKRTSGCPGVWERTEKAGERGLIPGPGSGLDVQAREHCFPSPDLVALGLRKARLGPVSQHCTDVTVASCTQAL